MRDLLEYGLARALESGLARLPEGAARAAGAALGRAAFRPLGVRKSVVERHLARAFPDRSRGWVERTARACYEHFGGEVAALARAGRRDPAELAAETAGARGTAETVRAALDGGAGALVVTGHLGNWELAGAVLAGLGFGVSAVVKRQGNARVHRRIERLRRASGVETVAMSVAGRRVPEALDRGDVVALVADQDARGKGVFVPFLGRPASTFRGPALLALRHRVPLVFGALVREGGRYRALARRVWSPEGGLEVGEGAGPGGRPAPGRGGEGAPGPEAPGEAASGRDAPGRNGGAAELALTRAWIGELERAVRARPEQYFWFHRRWKTRPEPDRDRS